MRLSKARKEMVTAMMKDSIVDAAGSVLEEHGIGGVTMDRVATMAGLTKGSLYNYFADKNDLMQFIFGRLVDPFFEAIEEISKENLPAQEKLEKILRVAWERSSQHKGLLRLLAETDQENEIRKKGRPRFLRILMSIFDQGIKEGSFRPHHTTHSGRMLMGCLSELFEMQAEDAPNGEVNGYVEVLIEAVFHGYSIHVEDVSKTKKP